MGRSHTLPRSVITASGWLVAALILAASGARWVHSQSALPEGGFVIGQDDSRWVVAGGTRFPIAFVADDAGTLAALPVGPPVATVGEAAAAIAALPAPSGAPPAPAPAPGPANPAETLIGQRATMCSYGVPI